MDAREQNKLFEAWAMAYQGMVRSVAHAFATDGERDELAREILAALWLAIPAFHGKCKPSTFVYRVAHNHALTWQRGRRNYRRKLEQYAFAGPPPAKTGDDPRIEALYAAIHQLDGLDRSIILLYLDKLTYAEIAEVLGLRANAVGVRIHRIKDKLLQRMKENDHEL